MFLAVNGNIEPFNVHGGKFAFSISSKRHALGMNVVNSMVQQGPRNTQHVNNTAQRHFVDEHLEYVDVVICLTLTT